VETLYAAHNTDGRGTVDGEGDRAQGALHHKRFAAGKRHARRADIEDEAALSGPAGARVARAQSHRLRVECARDVRDRRVGVIARPAAK